MILTSNTIKGLSTSINNVRIRNHALSQNTLYVRMSSYFVYFKVLCIISSFFFSLVALNVHYDKELIGKINFIGNSVNRGRSFALRAVLNGHYETRQSEKAMCGAAVGDESLHDICEELDGNNEFNTTIAYSYSNTIYSPKVKKLLDLDF